MTPGLPAYLPGCLNEWLWPLGWLPAGWLDGCLAAWLAGFLPAWLTASLTVWLFGSLDGSLAD